MGIRIIHVTATGEDHGAYMKCERPLFVIELNGIGGTEFLTGPALPLLEVNAILWINGVFKGDGLGILYISRLPLNEPCIIFADDFLGTFFCTYSTGNTFVHVHITGILGHVDFKIPLLSGYLFDL
jgi:hypothetical protein